MVLQNGMLGPLALLHEGLNLAKMSRAVRNVAVRHVVEHPAERIQHGRIVTHLATEEPACPEETLTAGGKNLFGLVEVVYFFQPHHLKKKSVF